MGATVLRPLAALVGQCEYSHSRLSRSELKFDERPLSIGKLLRRLDLNRESVLVVRGDTLVPGDAVLADDDVIEIRPVISGGALA